MNQEWIPRLRVACIGGLKGVGEVGRGAQQHSLGEVRAQIKEGHLSLHS